MMASPKGISSAANLQVQRNAEFTLARLLVAEHEHGQALHGKAPHHAERVGFAQYENVSAAQNDGGELQPDDQIQNAVRGAETAVGLAKPVGENSILGNAVQDAVGADDRGVHGPGEHERSHDHDKDAEDQAHLQRPRQVHRQAADGIIEVALAHGIGNDHDREKGHARGENQAVHENDEAGFFQVAELGMLHLAIDLGHGLFPAHGQHGVTQADQDADQAHRVRQVGVLQPAERIGSERQIAGKGEGRKVHASHIERIPAPNEHHDDHHGGHVHDAQGLFAGLMHALDVFPPEIKSDQDGKERGGGIRGQHRLHVEIVQKLVQQADQIQTRRNAADRPRQDVIEHQGGNGEFGQRRAHGLFDHAVDAATHEHAAALDVHGANRVRATT